ncbi:hypothetical protein GCM10012287_02910 [Streptomyces daqingensis]|uniref:Transposase n=1 Tax=Streptomyces daqingensis TaxID=1472640 RepID=A0ABQ2LRK9_9ACTN|nr:hypothetical protein [Streptomyces daqingensis]GGO42319.1 hypothetical protein GCM10012287_02910 [Streptomyces daqingensis]
MLREPAPLTKAEREHGAAVAAALTAVAEPASDSFVRTLRLAAIMRNWLRREGHADVSTETIIKMLRTSFTLTRDSERRRLVHGLKIRPEYDTDVVSRPTPNGWTTYRRQG